jgi:hypothetical protein
MQSSCLWSSLVLLGACSGLSAQETLPAPIPVPTPTVPTIVLHERHGHVTPQRQGFHHTGGGNIDITQPTPDTVIITMSGVAVAGRHPCKDSFARLQFELEQCFDVVWDKAPARPGKLTLEARVIGLLRSVPHGGGSALESDGCATIVCGPVAIASVCAPGHSVTGGENLSINDRAGPVSVPVVPGSYTLHQTFTVAAQQPCTVVLCKTSSAEFAPDPALNPLWISYWQPFHGAIKGNFGFQVMVRISPDGNPRADKK